MVGVLDFAYPAVAVSGKLGGCVAGCFCGFSYHLRFYGIQSGELIVDVGVGEGYSFFQEFRLTVEEFAHLVYFLCGDSDGAADGVIVVEGVGAVLVGSGIVCIRGIYGDFIASNAV